MYKLLFWRESRQIVGAQLGRISYAVGAVGCVWPELHLWKKKKMDAKIAKKN